MTDGISRDDVLLLGLVGVGAVWLGILNPGSILDDLARWPIEHKLLVPAQEGLMPVFAGLGLGVAQLGVIRGILIAASDFSGFSAAPSSRPKKTAQNDDGGGAAATLTAADEPLRALARAGRMAQVHGFTEPSPDPDGSQTRLAESGK